jgi:hypothetical protein
VKNATNGRSVKNATNVKNATSVGLLAARPWIVASELALPVRASPKRSKITLPQDWLVSPERRWQPRLNRLEQQNRRQVLPIWRQSNQGNSCDRLTRSSPYVLVLTLCGILDRIEAIIQSLSFAVSLRRHNLNNLHHLFSDLAGNQFHGNGPAIRGPSRAFSVFQK